MEQSFQELMAAPPRPLRLINMLKYYRKASYEEGASEAELSGKEAYELYLSGARKPLADAGAKVLLDTPCAPAVIDRCEGDFERVIIVEYPSQHALMEMAQTEEYQRALRHRTAALASNLTLYDRDE